MIRAGNTPSFPVVHGNPRDRDSNLGLDWTTLFKPWTILYTETPRSFLPLAPMSAIDELDKSLQKEYLTDNIPFWTPGSRASRCTAWLRSSLVSQLVRRHCGQPLMP